MDEFEKNYSLSLVLRLLGFLLLLSLIGGVSYYALKEPRKAKFDALQALTFEVLAFEDQHNQFAFPTDNEAALKYYLNQASSSLGFQPKILTGAKDLGYVPKGVSVLDYDVAKIEVTGWVNKDQTIYHFVFDDLLSTLPASEQATFEGFTYQPYASDRLRLIAWQYPNNGPMGFLVGRLSFQDLAKIAKSSL